MKSHTYYAVQVEIELQGKKGKYWVTHVLASNIPNFNDATEFKRRAKKAGYAARVVEVTTTHKVVSK